MQSNGIIGSMGQGIQFVDEIDVFAVSFPGGRCSQQLSLTESLKCRVILKHKETKPPPLLHVMFGCLKIEYAGDYENHIHSVLRYFTESNVKKHIFPIPYTEERKSYLLDFGTEHWIRFPEPGEYYCFFRLVHRVHPSSPQFIWCESTSREAVFPISDSFLIQVK